jgi:hypothetical protein
MNGLVDPTLSTDPYILKWWSDVQDEAIIEQMQVWQWYWHLYITDAIVAVTAPNVLEAWKKEDPLCERGVGKNAWNNVLSYFAFARARERGFFSKLRKPSWKTCPLCNSRFLENSLPEPLAKRIGIDSLDFCAPCLSPRVLQGTGSASHSPQDVGQYLRALSALIQAVPHQGFGEDPEDLLYRPYQEKLEILRLLTQKPKTSHIKKLFGSWLHALIAAEILENGARETSRGTMCLAKDGHVCYSLAEKTIDDFLYAHQVQHKKEPHYPGSNYRADFLVKGAYVEYFGLAGDDSYDSKTKLKIELAAAAGIRLIQIYPKNLVDSSWLRKTLLSI